MPSGVSFPRQKNIAAGDSGIETAEASSFALDSLVSELHKAFSNPRTSRSNNFNNHAAKSDSMEYFQDVNSVCVQAKGGRVQVAKIIMAFVYKMWKSKTLCDVILETAQGEIPAHKVVLAAYSDKLLASFDVEKSTSPKVVIDLRSFQKTSVQCVLEFCYTAEINLNDGNVCDITMLSKELGIKYLTEMCIHFLSQFTIENAFLFHSICSTVKLSALAFRIWEFICENFEAVSKTEQFKKEDIVTVSALLREDQLKVSSETVVLEAAIRWLEADPNRHIHAEEMASCVRLPLIKAEEIVTKSGVNSLLMSTPGGAQKMYKAMCYHALSVHKSAMAKDYAAHPRTGPIK